MLGVLLIVVYLGRLIVLTPSSPQVLLPAALTGSVVNPLWYLLLGLALRRNEARTSAPAQAIAWQRSPGRLPSAQLLRQRKRRWANCL